jgi:hypothetical protein
MPSRWNKDPWAGQTVVYHYGCPVWADFGAGKGRDDIAIEQLYLANRFWNDLVESRPKTRPRAWSWPCAVR